MLVESIPNDADPVVFDPNTNVAVPPPGEASGLWVGVGGTIVVTFKNKAKQITYTNVAAGFFGGRFTSVIGSGTTANGLIWQYI